MGDLLTIVRATRASALALTRMHRLSRKLATLPAMATQANGLRAAYERARRDYVRANATLARNPL
jgi:hypothetical protein